MLSTLVPFSKNPPRRPSATQCSIGELPLPPALRLIRSAAAFSSCWFPADVDKWILHSRYLHAGCSLPPSGLAPSLQCSRLCHGTSMPRAGPSCCNPGAACRLLILLLLLLLGRSHVKIVVNSRHAWCNRLKPRWWIKAFGGPQAVGTPSATPGNYIHACQYETALLGTSSAAPERFACLCIAQN